MTVRTVLQLGHPLLRQPSAPVADPTAPDVAALAADLADTVAHWRATTGYGRGIAAPQVGDRRRVVVIRLPGEAPWVLVNPQIVAHSAETATVWDGCLCFLSIFMQVERWREVAVRYQDLRGAWHTVDAGAERDLGELLQHEIDHLDGILALDRMTDVRTLVSREEFERRYRAESPYA